MDWNLEAAVERIDQRGYIFDIGQLPANVKRGLDRLVKQGRLEKQQAMWPDWYVGTTRKTGWRLA